jgi:hypothetical protein
MVPYKDNNDAEEWGRYNFFPPAEPVVTTPPAVDPRTGLAPGQVQRPTNHPGYKDLAYWKTIGVNEGDIFDVSTGQIKPGWQRTAKGYERVAVGGTDTGDTTTTGGGDTGDTSGMPEGDWGYLTEPFTGTPPAWRSWAGEAAPQIVRPPEFSFREFQMPTTDSIYADPSYKFRFGEGQRALEQGAAAQGTLRTGGTLKDLVNYGQNAASQEYGNIVDRAVNTHNLGLNQALGTYATNWGVGRDVLDREIDIWGAKNTSGQRENELSNRRDLDRFLAEFDIFDRNRKRAGDVLFGAANVGNV